MPESYDRPTRGRTRRVYIHTYIHILFYFRAPPPKWRYRGWRGERGQYHNWVTGTRPQCRRYEYVNQITCDKFRTVLSGLHIILYPDAYLYLLCDWIYYTVRVYRHSEKDNFLCRHNFGSYRRTRGVGWRFWRVIVSRRYLLLSLRDKDAVKIGTFLRTRWHDVLS